uniref:Putative gata zinc finger domain-containing protein 7-like isoform x4 n=1 Tax=Tabanus bromius TaxID=304241 RepID=A0A0K8TRM4_TABBR
MSQIGRAVKNLEAPRPLKSQSRSQIKNYMLIEELIQLIESVAITLASGISNPEPMALLVQNLRLHGPQLETVSKDTLDRAFVTFRNASQDERLNIMTRLNLLELIELRAKSWQDDGINTYYKHKATNVEPDIGGNATTFTDQTTLGSTSPTSIVGANIGQSNTTTQILGPGELIRTSGKFPKPTKIPGKNYSKDEVVIRNADSGKVMGIKGRRVHMIEELSETIISFQRVNPGAKERLVQITGPNEEKINYAKQLIEDTIRRNASPVRLEPSMTQGGTGGGGGSCSSLASSASDETVPRTGGNRNNTGTTTTIIMNNLGGVTNQSNLVCGGMVTGNKLARSAAGNQILSHSFSTNDASLGEYKYTVNVGQHLIKITGDCCELVRVAKLVLDDYFSSNEFLASVEAGASFDGSTMMNSTSTPTTPMAQQFVPQSHQLISSPFADSGIGLNYMASHGISNSNMAEGDDDVFIVETNDSSANSNSSVNSGQANTAPPVNGLARSRRSHFSRKDSAPDGVGNFNKTPSEPKSETVRIVHEYERLIYYSKSPHSWSLPRDWNKIVENHPSLVRNKDLNDETNRFDADKYMAFVKSGKRILSMEDDTLENESPDAE